MILSRDQILALAQAANGSQNGTKFYLEEGTDGKVRFGAIITVEKKKPITLTGYKKTKSE